MVVHGHGGVTKRMIVIIIIIGVRILKGHAKNNSKYETVKHPSKDFDVGYDLAFVLIGCKLLVFGMIIE